MMSLINDRDLLLIESSVFPDCEAAGTILATGTNGSVTGTTFSSATANFETAGVEEGHVATVNGKALEVLARPTTTSLTVSLPRLSDEDPSIPPAAGTGLKFSVTTFDRLIVRAQAWALGVVGLDALDPVQPLDETNIVNVEEFCQLIALRTICDAFALSAAGDPASPSLAQRAAHFRERLRRAMNMTNVLLDLNGDGVADAARRMTTIALSRR